MHVYAVTAVIQILLQVFILGARTNGQKKRTEQEERQQERKKERKKTEEMQLD